MGAQLLNGGTHTGHLGTRAAGVLLGALCVQSDPSALLAEPTRDPPLPLPAQGALPRGFRDSDKRIGVQRHRKNSTQGCFVLSAHSVCCCCCCCCCVVVLLLLLFVTSCHSSGRQREVGDGNDSRCAPAGKLPHCNASQVSLVTKTIGKIARVAQGQNGEQTHAEATCRCTGQGSGVHYRRAHGNNSADLTYYEQRQYFTCETLRECRPGEPCGHVTRDHYATYKACNCPAHHLCTVPLNFSDRKVVNVREPLYEGSAYLALCLPK
ncbi:hypothetical protein HPB51_028962 [Rhipicephalus microplus]|uniref:Uncharacterized protein n=1 Tax=Rhipicephalus microplus TaxID=6941 RepID=A0A9J6CW79_RHIMP|nr:hypothetical protein HPB51_028962 [Rhipicephalus microplus]